MADPSVGAGYEALAFHPDGVLLGACGGGAVWVWVWGLGCWPHGWIAQVGLTRDLRFYTTIPGTGTAENKVRMWDIKTQANVATFEEHNGAVKGLAFSENG